MYGMCNHRIEINKICNIYLCNIISIYIFKYVIRGNIAIVVYKMVSSSPQF